MQSSMLSSFSHVQLFETHGLLVCQVSLSMEFAKQEYWSGLQFPTPGDESSQPRDQFPHLLFPAFAGEFFTSNATWQTPL